MYHNQPRLCKDFQKTRRLTGSTRRRPKNASGTPKSPIPSRKRRLTGPQSSSSADPSARDDNYSRSVHMLGEPLGPQGDTQLVGPYRAYGPWTGPVVHSHGKQIPLA